MNSKIFLKSTLVKRGAFLFLILLASGTFDVHGQLNTFSFENFSELQDFLSSSDDRVPLISAHRGGSYQGYPENAIETFTYTLSKIHAVIECDVRMTSDGVLVMLHDDKLDRTTSCKGYVNEKKYEELKECRLKDENNSLTEFRIPTLRETLRWAEGKTILMLDVKRGIDFERVIGEVSKEGANNRVAIITYTPKAAGIVFRLKNDLMISATIRNKDEWERIREQNIPSENLVAFVGTSEPTQDLYEILHKEGIYATLGTMGNLDRKAISSGEDIYGELVRNGADILSTDRPLEAYQVVMEKVSSSNPKMRYFENSK